MHLTSLATTDTAHEQQRIPPELSCFFLFLSVARQHVQNTKAALNNTPCGAVHEHEYD
jgi:hypothetical protein